MITASGDLVKLRECSAESPMTPCGSWSEGAHTRVAWDPFNVQSVSPESGCLLTVFQVVDDPRDGLLSCGAHGTLCETEWGKQECEGANMYNNTIPLLHRGCLSSCSLERDIYETDGSSLQFWQDESHSKAAAKSTSVSV